MNRSCMSGYKENKAQLAYKEKEDTFQKAIPLAKKLEDEETEWNYTEEPHVSRRQQILTKYPEIKKLMGPDVGVFYFCTVEVILQLIACYIIYTFDLTYSVIIVIGYCFGAFLNHSLGIGIHESAHNLPFGHKYGWANRLTSIWVNLPLVVPFGISYKKYHLQHHRYTGHDHVDVDTPLKIEALFFKSPLRKLIWLFFHPIIYAIRPFFKSPKPVTGWEVINIIVQFSFNLMIVQTLGIKPLFYLLFSTLICHGFHPMAGHYISEHYLFINNQATHSYYGPMNFLVFNVGYHVEHHDFPYIAGKHLPKLKKIAPEFYKDLPYYTSWALVIWDFIWKDNMGPQAHSITMESKQTRLEFNEKKDE